MAMKIAMRLAWAAGALALGLVLLATGTDPLPQLRCRFEQDRTPCRTPACARQLLSPAPILLPQAEPLLADEWGGYLQALHGERQHRWRWRGGGCG